MFNRIIVPLDGSRFAEAALAPARDLARAFGSRILVVEAVPPAGLPRLATGQADEPSFDRLDDADAYLHGVVASLREAGCDADMVLYIAEPGAGIARTAEVDHADLIVMTAHPRWKVDLLDNSSTTLQVLARSRIPILAWRAATGAEMGSMQEQALLARPESPILVPLDGSRFAEGALATAETLARTFHTYLVLVRAVEHGLDGPALSSGDRGPQAAESPAEIEAVKYLERIQAALARSGIGVTTVARPGIAVEVIDTAWRELDAGLILMASHGTTGIASSFLGSVAARVIEEVGAPVLVVRQDDRSHHIAPGAGLSAVGPLATEMGV
jgi:nucleotide-binding universal stress UspA family protein